VFEEVLKKIQDAVAAGRYEVTDPHFLNELIEDDLTMVAAEAAVLTGSITTRYMDDPRGPRYRIVGKATDGRSVAVVIRLKETGIPLFITVYVETEKQP
jgi:hypothetical protein